MAGDDNVPPSLSLAASLSWRFLMVASAVVVLALAASKLTIIVVPVSAALLLSTQLAPPARWLRNHGWPNAIATAAVLSCGVAVVLAASVAVVPAVLDQQGELLARLESGVAQTSEWLSTGPLKLPQDTVQRSVDRLGSELSTHAGTVVGGLFAGATALLNLVVGSLLTIFVLFFFLHDGAEIWDWTVHLFPSQQEATVRAIGLKTSEALTGYVRGVAMVALSDAILVGVALQVVGVPFVLPLAVVTFFGAFVPIAGLGFAGALATFIALVSRGPLAALIVVAAVTAMVQLESHVLSPLLVGRSVALHPMAVLLSVATRALLWGVAGAFLAVPLTLIVITAAAELFAVEPAC